MADLVQKVGGFYRWDIPASCWASAEYHEDTIKIIRQSDGEWHGCTEVDQCVHRDLTANEVAQIRAEFDLDSRVEPVFDAVHGQVA